MPFAASNGWNFALKFESLVATSHLSRGCFARQSPNTFSDSPRQ